MRRILRTARSAMVMFGIDPLQTIRTINGLPGYFRDLRTIKGQRSSAAREFPFGKLYPCLDDKDSDSGSAKGHYFHQDLLVAGRIHRANPNVHVDVGSRIDGLVAHVASYRPIEVIDIRPLSSDIPNVTFIQADFMSRLPASLVEYCDSVSCLHALEHFGLGRYGDPINYDGHLLGLNNLHSVLKKGGKLYFSVPIGPQRIEFNAHRVFSLRYLQECFDGKFSIDEFSYVDDEGDLHENVRIAHPDASDNFGCGYGCGIFNMTKL